MDDKSALVTSNAGMRLIAQQTLLNRGDMARLRTFIGESYSAAALESESVDRRLAALESAFAQTGKMRVQQVLATDKHHVVVLMKAEHEGGLYLNEIRVEEDYPHKITQFSHKALES